MSKDNRRLGRGLSSLISPTFSTGSGLVNEPEAAASTTKHPQSIPVLHPDPGPSTPVGASPEANGSKILAVDVLVPHRNQPRQTFEAASIGQLAASIARSGVVQPLVVRPIRSHASPNAPATQYEIVAGERRWRAAKAAGLKDVPVIVREVNDETAIELALVENIQREDLNAIDRSNAYQAYAKRYNLSPEDIAQRLGEDRTTVVNYLRLQELPDEVKDAVRAGQLTMGHARAILGFAGYAARLEASKTAIAQGLSVRALEELARKEKKAPLTSGQPGEGNPPPRQLHVADLEQRLQHAIGTKVRIHQGKRKASGRIVIDYYSLDDFERITKRLGLRDD